MTSDFTDVSRWSLSLTSSFDSQAAWYSSCPGKLMPDRGLCCFASGNLVLATPEAPELSGDARVAQLVILLLSHGPRGSEGVMLNRPSFACVEDLLGWG